MEELLEQINQTFDNCINTSNEDVALQLKIIKGNVNTIMKNYIGNTAPVQPINESSIEEPQYDLSKKCIFIVDDSSIVRNYLEKLLKGKYCIAMATDGADAIEKLSRMDEEQGFDAILLDLMMPNIDGFGVLEYMNSKNINIPVIVISGDNTGETITRAFQYNVLDMIEKPFDAKTIEDKIEHVLGVE